VDVAPIATEQAIRAKPSVNGSTKLAGMSSATDRVARCVRT
jgi:hypothetical protein